MYTKEGDDSILDPPRGKCKYPKKKEKIHFPKVFKFSALFLLSNRALQGWRYAVVRDLVSSSVC